jgi:hypothetical protein
LFTNTGATPGHKKKGGALADRVSLLLGGGAALAVGVGILFTLLQRSERPALAHVRHLAREVMEVAHSVHADLPRSMDDGEALRLRTECDYLGRRAEHVLRRPKGMRVLTDDRLLNVLERLHDDHRRMVELRLQADVMMSRRRRERRQPAAELVTGGE